MWAFWGGYSVNNGVVCSGEEGSSRKGLLGRRGSSGSRQSLVELGLLVGGAQRIKGFWIFNPEEPLPENLSSLEEPPCQP